jgi:hypothetical protein
VAPREKLFKQRRQESEGVVPLLGAEERLDL